MTELLNVIVELISLLIDTLPRAMFNILVKKTYLCQHTCVQKKDLVKGLSEVKS